MVMLVIVATSTALAMLMVMVMIMVFMIMMAMCMGLRPFSTPGPLCHFHIRLHGFHHFPNLWKKCIRILRGKTKLFRRIGDRNVRKTGHLA